MEIHENLLVSDITNPAVTRSTMWLIRMHCFLWKLLHVKSSHPRQDKSPYPTHNWNDDSDNNFTKLINVSVSWVTSHMFCLGKKLFIHVSLHWENITSWKQESSKCWLCPYRDGNSELWIIGPTKSGNHIIIIHSGISS